jgi:antitoxin (DNA-binding transcriptional repressor) of toxin-antitoxin stability system
MILKNISEAKAELAALIEAVQMGEAVILSNAGKQIARPTKYRGLAAPRKLGMLQGQIQGMEIWRIRCRGSN